MENLLLFTLFNILVEMTNSILFQSFLTSLRFKIALHAVLRSESLIKRHFISTFVFFVFAFFKNGVQFDILKIYLQMLL